MDFIFDCFFEEVLETIERSGLKTRQNRQNVIEQLDAIITGCSSGQDIPEVEVCIIAIESLVKYHRTMKSQNAEICRMGKYHNLLYIGLKIAWNWNVIHSATICTLLSEVYDCEKTFERLFLGAIFGTKAPYFIAGWRSDFKDQDENVRAVVFFLHHACNERLQFKIDGTFHDVPFIDVPMESCGNYSPIRVSLQFGVPDVLTILLRHGANPSPSDGISPVLVLIDKLSEYSEKKSYPYQLVSCLKILLTSIPSIDIPYKPLVFEERKNFFLEKYSALFEDNLISCDRVFGVVELKHLCRCSIRETLRQNFQLPHGISTLKIPKPLRRYIDLK